MVVTRLEPVTKTRYKVYIDEEFAFVLYKGELTRYHIKEEAIVEEADFHKIKKEIILKRAKLRAMHLLNDMSRTESQLRTKLRQGYYTEDIIDATITYVASFGYINDNNYAINYIQNKQAFKSKKEIYAGLCQKGLAKEIIDLALEETYQEQDEIDAIHKITEKKKYDCNTATDGEKKKMCAYLMRKGFRYDDIRQVIQVSDGNA
ncbi:MAG: regulatory protein RecX [Lachnospiraceae bacterium]